MISAIVAVEQNQGIGFNGSIPWPHLKADMQWFKKITTNNVVIMGSNTWKSLNYKPLPNRVNVVLSRTHDYSGDNAADHTFSDPNNALTFCQVNYPDKEIFIIGGGKIYDFYLPYIDKFYITEIQDNFECDTFFNLTNVQTRSKVVNTIASYTDPINFIIKEYII
jgi:dihydrofolate reductase